MFLRFAILLITLFSVACAPNKSIKSFIQDVVIDPIFSTRNQSHQLFVGIIRLKNPALLENATHENGKIKISESLKQLIKEEHKSVIGELAKISPEIKVIYQYELVLNALSIVAPNSVMDQVSKLSSVQSVQKSIKFQRPKALGAHGKYEADLVARNSVKFIGAAETHAKHGLTGKGMRVGVLDTGIDYSHKMLGGVGDPAIFENMNTDIENEHFPNAKVVGGIDLVGRKYNAASLDDANRIPKQDLNPMDEGGHGTHVAGTIAGIGDNVNTYSGVAPDADLYAIKVFGEDGSTDDHVIIAGFEYAMDPNKDGQFDDQLHVVNLSLGSGYGTPQSFYDLAIKNLSQAGTVVVASAGNSGDDPYIVGSPSVSDDAISVAASIDDTDTTWKFPAIEANTVNNGNKAMLFAEAGFSKKLSEFTDFKSTVAYVGTAHIDLTEEQKNSIKGKIALVDRGIVPFVEKMRRVVDAGAIAMVVANNQPANPFVMGGDGEFNIPALMISLDSGNYIKENLKNSEVTLDLKSPLRFETPEVIDTLTDFSSMGPRSFDGFVKPEISAPGFQIISAEMGAGDQGVAFNGTSMAAPHMAGVMALIKQKHQNLNSKQLKSVAMNTSKILNDIKVQKQGAGRVQVVNAIEAKASFVPSAINFGIVELESKKVLSKKVTIQNFSQETLNFSAKLVGHNEIVLKNNQNIQLAAGESKTISFAFELLVQTEVQSVQKDGWLVLIDQNGVQYNLPYVAVVNKLSNIEAKNLVVKSTSLTDSMDAQATLTLINSSKQNGQAYLFNLLAQDQVKTNIKGDKFESKSCDLESVGYRVVQNDGQDYLEVAAKFYDPQTTWNLCQLSILFDKDLDNKPDQELVGMLASDLEGLTQDGYVSVLLDAQAAQKLRKDYETDTLNGKTTSENYLSAIQNLEDLKFFDHSGVVILKVPMNKIQSRITGEFGIKVFAEAQNSNNVEFEDYLADTKNQWHQIDLNEKAQAFYDLPAVVELAANSSQEVEFSKGQSNLDLLVLMPQNSKEFNSAKTSKQSQILKPSYISQ